MLRFRVHGELRFRVRVLRFRVFGCFVTRSLIFVFECFVFDNICIHRTVYSQCSTMAINFTGDGNHKTYEELLCSAELTGGIHNLLICLSAINIFLSITAFLGNTLILLALHKKSSLHPPSKLLFRSLAATDLCVGIIVEPLHVTYWLSAINERWNICHHSFLAAFIAGNILCLVSLLTLTAIGVDRLLALLLGLRYRRVVTLKRTYLTVTVLWLVSIAGSAMYFWSNLITVWYGYIGISLCLVTSGFCYAIIFLTLRHHHIQAQNLVHHQGQPSQIGPLNIARYRKTVSSALWVQLALVVCYLPYGIVEILVTQGLLTSVYSIWGFAATLVYLNSSLNPILYCWKIREVRQAVEETIQDVCCS